MSTPSAAPDEHFQILAHLASSVSIENLPASVIHEGRRILIDSIAAILATTEVPLAAVVSYIVVGERFSAWQMIGAFLVVVGVLLVSIPQSRWQRASKRLWAAIS